MPHPAISFKEAESELTGLGFLQGGNLNFTVDQDTFNNFAASCGASGGASSFRCDDGLHFQQIDGTYYVHLDTANPFSGSVGDFFDHSSVDVFLGNVGYDIIPRPWP